MCCPKHTACYLFNLLEGCGQVTRCTATMCLNQRLQLPWALGTPQFCCQLWGIHMLQARVAAGVVGEA